LQEGPSTTEARATATTTSIPFFISLIVNGSTEEGRAFCPYPGRAARINAAQKPLRIASDVQRQEFWIGPVVIIAAP
jgi:hypothetical protein